jgi:hypothetical protein
MKIYGPLAPFALPRWRAIGVVGRDGSKQYTLLPMLDQLRANLEADDLKTERPSRIFAQLETESL